MLKGGAHDSTTPVFTSPPVKMNSPAIVMMMSLPKPANASETFERPRQHQAEDEQERDDINRNLLGRKEHDCDDEKGRGLWRRAESLAASAIIERQSGILSKLLFLVRARESMDMTLAEMHGLQTLQQIGRLNTNVPVVVTGETSDDWPAPYARSRKANHAA